MVSFSFLALILLLFVFVTLFYMIIIQVTSDFPGLIAAAKNESVIRSIKLSLYAGLLSTIVSFLVGVPAAYILARKEFFGKRVVESILDLPVVVPHTVAGIALLTIFGSRGLLG